MGPDRPWVAPRYKDHQRACRGHDHRQQDELALLQLPGSGLRLDRGFHLAVLHHGINSGQNGFDGPDTGRIVLFLLLIPLLPDVAAGWIKAHQELKLGVGLDGLV